jgi:thiol-disulfide isomerase/thioredoxin
VHATADAVPPGLGVGALAPGFSIPGANGETVSLDDLLSRGKPVALIFAAPGCGPCSVLAPELARWHQAVSGTLTLGLVGMDTYLRYEEVAARNGASVSETYEQHADLAAEADQLNAVFASYRLSATPSAVLVTPEGTIASATVDGRPAIEALIRLALNGRGAAGLRVHHAPVSGWARAGTR